MLPDFQLNFPLMNTSQFDEIYVISFAFNSQIMYFFNSGADEIQEIILLSKYEVKNLSLRKSNAHEIIREF